MRTFTAVVERCPDTGLYVGYVPCFPGAHTQAETLDELQGNIHEVIEMVPENGEPLFEADSIGTQTMGAARRWANIPFCSREKSERSWRNSTSWKCVKGVLIGNIGIERDGVQQRPFIKGGIFHRFCYGR